MKTYKSEYDAVEDKSISRLGRILERIKQLNDEDLNKVALVINELDSAANYEKP